MVRWASATFLLGLGYFFTKTAAHPTTLGRDSIFKLKRGPQCADPLVTSRLQLARLVALQGRGQPPTASKVYMAQRHNIHCTALLTLLRGGHIQLRTPQQQYISCFWCQVSCRAATLLLQQQRGISTQSKHT
jgi:hypothetical protein